jgi:hypothetical protein
VPPAHIVCRNERRNSKEKLLICQDKSSVVPGEMFAENERPDEMMEIGTLRLLC